jgi:4'-phosphopantetheinyl transferase EntD
MDIPELPLPPEVRLETGPILFEGWDAVREEMEHALGFAPSRRAEFLTGRTLARRALRRLGVEAPAILPGERRSPGWPAGTVGSITHTREACAVVVALASDHAGLGLDWQPLGGMKEAFAAKVLTDPERTAWEALHPGDGAGERTGRLALVFSAKEAFYKLQFPRTGAWIGFQAAGIEVDAEGPGTFAARLEDDIGPGYRAGDRYLGRYAFGGGTVATLLAVSPS